MKVAKPEVIAKQLSRNVRVYLAAINPVAIVSIAIAFFGLFLLPGIWHIITWLDNVVLQAVWSDQNHFVGQVSIGRMAWDLVIMSSYAIFTYLWILLTVSKGGKAASSMSSAMNSASAASTASMVGGTGLVKTYMRDAKQRN